MASFKDLPINQKLSLLITLTCTCALILASTAFVTNEYISARRELVDTVSSLAAITAENSTAALAFQSRPDAQRTLQALQADPRLIYAALFDREGKLFAEYGQTDASKDPILQPGFHEEGRELVHVRQVYENQEILGTLYVRASLSQIYAALKTYLGITALILILSTTAAFVLSYILRRRITGPILSLAETTRRVSLDHDYALRAQKMGADELGDLSDSFNRMMSRIQASDAELRRSQDRLKLALDVGHIGVWDWDPTTNESVWDDTVYELLGLTRSETKPSFENFLKRVVPEDRAAVRDALKVIPFGDRPASSVYRVIWSDGSVHYLASRGGLYTDPATGDRRVTGVTIDITQAKRAEEEVRRLNEELEQRVVKRTEELASANKELESFTYSVSHDLRAPLRHVNGFAQILEQEFADGMPIEARRLLGKIRYGARNMGHLVDDLLRLARVGRQALLYQKCSLRSMVEEIVRELRPEVENRKIEWKITELPTVSCDPGLIRQVFSNLISNAVKYSRTRQVAVIEIGSYTTDTEVICFIRDNGVGFEMKYADKLFGVFQRLHRAEEFEGTGVGLAIVQRVVHKHGGRLFVEATPDLGASFSFALPRELAAAA